MDVVTAKIFDEVVTVRLRGSFARPLHSSTRTSCTDNPMDRDSQTLNCNTFNDNIDQILKDLENEG